MAKRYSYEEFKQIITELSECKVLTPPSDFKGASSKVLLQCPCGNEFQTDLSHFRNQNQRQCQTCGRRSSTAKARLSREDLDAKLAEFGCEYISGEYQNRRSKIEIRCSCGHNRHIAMNSVLYQSFSGLCGPCAIRRQHDGTRLSVEDVRILMAAKGLTLISTEYENAKTPLKLRCGCGQEFVSSYDLIQQKVKKPCCRVCSGRISSGEKAVATWLEENGFAYEREKTFPGCQGPYRQRYRFDFYIPEKNLCIEYDGQGHFKVVNYSGKLGQETLTRTLWDTQERDFLKDQFCAENGIDLIRISYDEINDIPEILRDKLIPR